MSPPTTTWPGVTDFMRFVFNTDVQATVVALLKAREELPSIEAAVKAIVEPVFSRFEFWTRDGVDGEPRRRIEREDDLYLGDMELPEMAAYDEARNAALVAAGYPIAAEGFCPALVAGHEITKLEGRLLKLAGTVLHPCFKEVPYPMRESTLEALITAVTHRPQP